MSLKKQTEKPSKSAKKPSIRKPTQTKIIQWELIRGRKSHDIAQDYKGTGKNIAILVAGNFSTNFRWYIFWKSDLHK